LGCKDAGTAHASQGLRYRYLFLGFSYLLLILYTEQLLDVEQEIKTKTNKISNFLIVLVMLYVGLGQDASVAHVLVVALLVFHAGCL
jgi:hypothetical protein